MNHLDFENTKNDNKSTFESHFLNIDCRLLYKQLNFEFLTVAHGNNARKQIILLIRASMKLESSNFVRH